MIGSDAIDTPWGSPPVWNDGGVPFDNYDVPGWILTTQDGTHDQIKRGAGNTVVYPSGADNFLTVYGPPKLTQIVQRSGDTIQITDNGIFHYAGGTNLTRSVLFDRDAQDRITAIHDQISGTNGLPTVRKPVRSGQWESRAGV